MQRARDAALSLQKDPVNEAQPAIDQHDEMLRYCLRIAEMDIPAILKMLDQLDAKFRQCSGVDHSQMDELIDDNIVIARMALAIHAEVNRRKMQRAANDAAICHAPMLIQ